ncbi:MAG: EAL domain-containing protein [Pseudomonadota bacterium]
MTKASSVDEALTLRHGRWDWAPEGGELTVTMRADDELRHLAGKWSLDAFSLLLDGLSRARLMRAFDARAKEVSCALGLSDGRRIRLVGTFSEDRSAGGDVLAVSNAVGEVGPGPILSPAYQPIVSLRTGRTAGFEALARWKGEEGVTDATFEDPALATNMLIHAAESLGIWRAATGDEELFVQVNLTGRDLAQGAEVARLIETLRQGYDLPTGVLKIELTEQAALHDQKRAIEAVKKIQSAGAALVLDDFGSGHSSFAWLADMPADALKVDADLTQRLGDQRAEHILEAITLLAQRLDMSATAEGVEDKAMVTKLRSLGFDYVQGFAFARPMGRDAALAFLQDAS